MKAGPIGTMAGHDIGFSLYFQSIHADSIYRISSKMGFDSISIDNSWLDEASLRL